MSEWTYLYDASLEMYCIFEGKESRYLAWSEDHAAAICAAMNAERFTDTELKTLCELLNYAEVMTSGRMGYPAYTAIAAKARRMMEGTE